MAEIDHNANIARIVSNIKLYADLFDDGHTAGKLRRVVSGRPANNMRNRGMMPYAYVSVAQSQSKVSEFGSSHDAEVPVIISYEIGIIAQHQQPALAEEQLYNLVKNMREFLVSNSRQAEENGQNPIFFQSKIKDTSYDQNNFGQKVQYCTIILEAQIGTPLTMTLPGITDAIPVISQTSPGTGWDTNSIPNDDGTRDVAPTVYDSKRFYKIEITDALYTGIENLIKAGRIISITTTRGENDISFDAFLKRISPSQELNGIRMAVIEIELLDSS